MYWGSSFFITPTMAYQAALEGENLRKGSWLEEEDKRLTMYVKLKGERKWDALAQESGLRRSGRSCRLRWLNYLRPHLKHGHITVEEEQTILQLHELWGNKWSKIARMLPGRTDNEIKNYWRTHLWKKVQNHNGAVSAGNLQCALDKRQQGIFFEEGDDSNAHIEHNFYQHHDLSENFWTNDAYSDDPGFSDFTLPSSPYEIGLSDWISELSSDQSGIAWTPDYDAWNCSSSIWDMN